MVPLPVSSSLELLGTLDSFDPLDLADMVFDKDSCSGSAQQKSTSQASAHSVDTLQHQYSGEHIDSAADLVHSCSPAAALDDLTAPEFQPASRPSVVPRTQSCALQQPQPIPSFSFPQTYPLAGHVCPVEGALAGSTHQQHPSRVRVFAPDDLASIQDAANSLGLDLDTAVVRQLMRRQLQHQMPAREPSPPHYHPSSMRAADHPAAQPFNTPNVYLTYPTAVLLLDVLKKCEGVSPHDRNHFADLISRLAARGRETQYSHDSMDRFYSSRSPSVDPSPFACLPQLGSIMEPDILGDFHTVNATGHGGAYNFGQPTGHSNGSSMHRMHTSQHNSFRGMHACSDHPMQLGAPCMDDPTVLDDREAAHYPSASYYHSGRPYASGPQNQGSFSDAFSDVLLPEPARDGGSAAGSPMIPPLTRAASMPESAVAAAGHHASGVVPGAACSYHPAQMLDQPQPAYAQDLLSGHEDVLEDFFQDVEEQLSQELSVGHALNSGVGSPASFETVVKAGLANVNQTRNYANPTQQQDLGQEGLGYSSPVLAKKTGVRKARKPHRPRTAFESHVLSIKQEPTKQATTGQINKQQVAVPIKPEVTDAKKKPSPTSTGSSRY